MANPYNGVPKVTQCIIQVQKHLADHAVIQWDSYNIKTSVKKYFIGLGSDDIVGKNPLISQSHPPELEMEGGRKVNSSFPLIRINHRGFKAVKCPTISSIFCLRV